MSASDSPKSLANRCIRTQTGPRFSHYEPEDRRFESCRVHQAFPMKPPPASFLTPLMDSSERRTRTIPDTQTPNVCIWISLISPIHNMSVSFTIFVLHYCSDQRRVEALPRIQRLHIFFRQGRTPSGTVQGANIGTPDARQGVTNSGLAW